MNNKLEKLNKLMELMQNDTVTPKEIEQFLVLCLDVIKKSKDKFESLSIDSLDKVNNAIKYIDSEHSKIVAKIFKETSDSKKDFEKRVSDINKMIVEIKAIKVRDGFDGKDGTDGKDGRDGKDGSPDSPEEIAEKLNLLTEVVDISVIKGLTKRITDLTNNIANGAISAMPVTTSFVNGVRAKNINFNGSNFSVSYNGDTANINFSSSASAVTLAEVSAASLLTADSIYQMTSTIPVEFRSSDGNSILQISETNEQILAGASATFGNATNPHYSFLQDVNTGIYNSAADTLNLVTGGTTRLTIDSSGNALFFDKVYSTSTSTGSYFDNTGFTVLSGSAKFNAEDDMLFTIDFNNNDADARSFQWGKNSASSPTELMRLTEAGDLGVGTASPTTRVQISGPNNDTFGILRVHSTGGSLPNSGISLTTDVSGSGYRNWQIATNYTTAGTLEFLRSSSNGGNPTTFVAGFTSAGNFGVGTSAASKKMEVAATDGTAILSLRRVDTTIFGGNVLGELQFTGDGDGTAKVGASIVGAVASAENWGTNDYPAELQFWTTNDGAATPTQKAVLTSGGLFGLGVTAPADKFSILDGTGYLTIGELASGYTGIAFANAAVSTANYALTGDGSGTFLNVPTGGSIYHRVNNASAMTMTSTRLSLNTVTSIRAGSEWDLTNTIVAGVGIADFIAQGTNAQALRVIPGASTTGYSIFGQNNSSFFEFHRLSTGTDRMMILAPTTATNGYNFVSYATVTAQPITFGFSTNLSSKTDMMAITTAGVYVGGSSTPTAKLHLTAGTATASTAPLKFTSGTNLTTAEAGAMEYNGTNLFFTRTGTQRETVNTTVTKTDTGDGTGAEGLFQINTFDNTFKVYAEGAWRTITTW